MQFDSLQAFLDMGGYGFYVWLSFIFCFGSMLILALSSKSEEKAIKNQIRKQYERDSRIKEAKEQQA